MAVAAICASVGVHSGLPEVLSASLTRHHPAGGPVGATGASWQPRLLPPLGPAACARQTAPFRRQPARVESESGVNDLNPSGHRRLERIDKYRVPPGLDQRSTAATYRAAPLFAIKSPVTGPIEENRQCLPGRRQRRTPLQLRRELAGCAVSRRCGNDVQYTHRELRHPREPPAQGLPDLSPAWPSAPRSADAATHHPPPASATISTTRNTHIRRAAVLASALPTKALRSAGGGDQAPQSQRSLPHRDCVLPEPLARARTARHRLCGRSIPVPFHQRSSCESDGSAYQPGVGLTGVTHRGYSSSLHLGDCESP